MARDCARASVLLVLLLARSGRAQFTVGGVYQNTPHASSAQALTQTLPAEATHRLLAQAEGKPRLRVSEIKARLHAAGVSTAGIVEKEELVRLLHALPDHAAAAAEAAVAAAAAAAAATTPASPSAASGVSVDATRSSPPPSPFVSRLPIVYMQGGAYAQLDAADGVTLSLLIDSGAAVTIISRASAVRLRLLSSAARWTLRSLQNPSLRLQVTVASAQQQMPAGVDGILGIDALRRYAAAEMDWEASTLRLHERTWVAPPPLAAQISSADRPSADRPSTAPPPSAARTIYSLPMRLKEMGDLSHASPLPFVDASFRAGPSDTPPAHVEALVDTGSPVTMVTPELAALAAMAPALGVDDVLTTGVDGQPTRMKASRCSTLTLGGAAASGGGAASGGCPRRRAAG